jgi:D-3-phosphoglycerate dehydrogenase / 2-oxoglutarate reductase
MSRKVLVTDHVFADLETERALLEPHGVELIEADEVHEQALIEAVADAEAVMVCYAKVPEPVVAAAADAGVKVISRYGIGFDNIDIDAATANGIVVTYVPDYCQDEVADHTIALLLGLARGVVDADREVRAGGWAVPQGAVHRLEGRRLAVIGAGGIGRKVIDRAKPFGFEIVAYDPFIEDWDLDVTRVDSIAEAFAEADAITLHVPMTEENRHMVGRESIAGMNRAPIVINTSRGPLVEMDAAAEALEKGEISGLGLDVTEVEPPPPDHPLRNHPRAVLTPHMGFYSIEAQQELQRRAAEEVVRALTGEPPHRPVNPEVLSAS